MPELPEVETVVRDLRNARVVGRTIRAAAVHWHRTVTGMTPDRFAATIRGLRITAVSRRAKYIVITLTRGYSLLIHLRMTGQIHILRRGTPAGPHDRLVADLDDGRALSFRDTRKFGRWHLLRDPQLVLGKLGPEPLEKEFTVAVLAGRLQKKKQRIKTLLLDQTFIAGVGNIYADEALWHAGVYPLRHAGTLRSDEIQALHRAIRVVLRRGIAARGTSLGEGKANFYSVDGRRGRHQENVQVFRRTGRPCPRCRTPIARIIVGQRSTHFCPHCQPAGPDPLPAARRTSRSA